MPLDPSEASRRVIAQILSKRLDLGMLANNLLELIQRGASPDTHRPLLESADDDVVKVGIWVQSELGSVGRRHADLLPRLLEHHLAYVRYFAVDSALSFASEADVELGERVLEHLADPDFTVREKVVNYLAHVPLEHLKAIEGDSPPGAMPTEIRSGLSLLLRGVDGSNGEAMLKSASPLLRRMGMALALRNGSRELFNIAASSDDEDLRKMALVEPNR